ncbi:hypothetical protein AB0G32_30240 [Streptomyces sp. NPDC023723]|uniref:hypothetical protein n=1 Tax=Streptomyces sp. NPDC023723 TaxID=3154323 RepID=UPI00340D5A10
MNSERPDHDGTGGEGTRAVRRRPRAVLTASVAAAVLLAGGGGAYLAATASDGSGGGGAAGASTPPPLVLDSPAADSTAGGYRTAGRLPDGPDSAPVYRAAGRVTEAQVTRLAEALDLAGKPVVRGASWTVGTVADGSGPVLRVAREAPGNWTFQRSAAAGDDCDRKDPVCPTGPTGEGPVSEAAAKKAAAPVLAAVGQDDAEVDAGQVLGTRRVVNAEPAVGGLPTYGWTTGVIVGAGGEVAGGSGRVAAPVKGDTYPVLDAERTLARMEQAPAASGGCASAVPLEGGGTGACGAESGAATDTVAGAVFGLAAQPVGGRETLVPSWLFEVRAAGAADPVTVPYPAVDPAYLKSAEPSPGPSTERDVEVTGYTAAGNELTVRFTGGVCAKYDAEAAEESRRVTVTVTASSDPGKVCIAIAKEYELTVELTEPLGGRAVVGSDGKPVPLAKEGARLPAPTGGR